MLSSNQGFVYSILETLAANIYCNCIHASEIVNYAHVIVYKYLLILRWFLLCSPDAVALLYVLTCYVFLLRDSVFIYSRLTNSYVLHCLCTCIYMQ